MNLSSKIRRNFNISLVYGGGAAVGTFLLSIIHDKFGLPWIHTPLKTWSKIAEGLPKLTLFCLGVFVVFFVGTLLFYKEKEVVICPECEEPFYKFNLPNLNCPKCNVATVDMKIFYKRNN
jgi:hypothetical protein